MNIKSVNFKIYFLVFLFFVGVLFFFFYSFYMAQTASDTSADTNNVRGWAWSGSIGWISFSCNDPSGNTNCGVGGSKTYGVHMVTDKNIDDGLYDPALYDFGALVGNAWSDAVGWITFDKSLATQNGAIFPLGGDPFPTKGYMAKIDFSVDPPTISGWARAITAADSDWSGWIKLDGTLIRNGDVMEFDGYSWGENVFGWILWRDPSIPYSVNLINVVPSVTADSTFFADIYADNRTPVFQFIYDSTNYYNMLGYSIEIRKSNGTFFIRQDSSSPMVRSPGDTVAVSYGSGSCFDELGGPVLCPKLDRDTTYDWTVSVKNNLNVFSSVSSGPQFYIQPRKYPTVNFYWDPAGGILPGEDVSLIGTSATVDPNTSICYDPADNPRPCSFDSGDKFRWTVPLTAKIISPEESTLTIDTSGGAKTITAPENIESLTIQFDSSGGCPNDPNPSATEADRTVSLQVLGEGLSASDWSPGTPTASGIDVCVEQPIPKFQEQRP